MAISEVLEVNKIYEGNALDVIRTFPDKCVNSVITSPPYWQLRDYGWDGQWGLEPTFQMYLENLWSLMDEIWRVLKDDGTAWINLGDTYNTVSGRMGEYDKYGGSKIVCDGANKQLDFKQIKDKNIGNKCLLLIPHRFALGCIERGWILRNDIIWAKRNCMPESVDDRFSKKHEYIFFMSKKEDYYFDLKTIRDNHIWAAKDKRSTMINGKSSNGKSKDNQYGVKTVSFSKDGKNPGSVSDFWDINTKPSKDKHYASFNTQLIDKPIIAGCPKDGIVLDPFCGTATTGCRAIDLDRKFIGIEGKEEYVKMGNRKLHKYLISPKLF